MEPCAVTTAQPLWLAGYTLGFIPCFRPIHPSHFLSVPTLGGRRGALALLEGEKVKVSATYGMSDS